MAYWGAIVPPSNKSLTFNSLVKDEAEIKKHANFVSSWNTDGEVFSDFCRRLYKNSATPLYRHYVMGFPIEDRKKIDEFSCHDLCEDFIQMFFKDFPVLNATHFNHGMGNFDFHNHILVFNCSVVDCSEIDVSEETIFYQKKHLASLCSGYGLAHKGIFYENGLLYDGSNIIGGKLPVSDNDNNSDFYFQQVDMSEEELFNHISKGPFMYTFLENGTRYSGEIPGAEQAIGKSEHSAVEGYGSFEDFKRRIEEIRKRYREIFAERNNQK